MFSSRCVRWRTSVWCGAGWWLCLLLPALVLAEDVAFRRHVINADAEFMAAAALDVNNDGKLDIASGGYWYEAPTWKKHFLRNVEISGGRPDGYAHQVLDVNADGWTDLVTINWRTRSLKWIEHPGAEGIAKDMEWKAHVIDVPGASETGRIVDLLGDGTPVILPAGSTFAAWYELSREPDAAGGRTITWIRHELPREVAGHGLGAGDINGDGRMDVVGNQGWAEAPRDPRKERWIWHPEFNLEQASIPILVVEVNGDGKNDIIYTRAHDYGIYWLEQSRDADNRITWIKHAIDTSVPGCHAPLWEDFDGDGVKELFAGRRYLAHEGRDPGEYDPQEAYRYQFDPKTRTWQRWLISYNDGICFSLDPKAVALTESGRLDLLCGGRHGLYWLENLGKGSGVAQKLTKDPLWFASYGDRANLLTVKDEAGVERPVKTAFDWGQRRAQILASLQAVLGPLPHSHQRVPLDMKVESEEETPENVRRKITYAADPSTRVSAYLLVPKAARRAAPAMLCLHDDATGGKEMPFAEELARRGYVCLVPDYPSITDGAALAKSGYASGAMQAVWNNVRGVDLLETLPEVSPRRIGVIGHGLGGQSALFTAALDYRLSAVVASCGFTSFPNYRGGDLADWASPRLAPRLQAVYQNDPQKIPFDFAELLGSLAPRAVYLHAPLGDQVQGVDGVKRAVANAAAVYELKRAERSLQATHPDGERGFDSNARAAAYTWLEQRMARTGF